MFLTLISLPSQPLPAVLVSRVDMEETANKKKLVPVFQHREPAEIFCRSRSGLSWKKET